MGLWGRAVGAGLETFDKDSSERPKCGVRASPALCPPAGRSPGRPAVLC